MNRILLTQKHIGYFCSLIGLLAATLIISNGCDMGTYEQRLNEPNPANSGSDAANN